MRNIAKDHENVPPASKILEIDANVPVVTEKNKFHYNDAEEKKP